MTLQEAKEQVAKFRGFEDWIALEMHITEKGSIIDFRVVYGEVSELYAQSCAQEARERAIEDGLILMRHLLDQIEENRSNSNSLMHAVGNHVMKHWHEGSKFAYNEASKLVVEYQKLLLNLKEKK